MTFHTHSRDRSWGGESKIVSFEQKVDIIPKRYSFTVRKSEEMVVIQHGVKRLDPLRNKKGRRKGGK